LFKKGWGDAQPFYILFGSVEIKSYICKEQKNVYYGDYKN